MFGKTLDEMTLPEVAEFLSVILKSRVEEYQALKGVWGENPTPKQTKQLEKLRKRIEDIKQQQGKLHSLLSIYGVPKK